MSGEQKPARVVLITECSMADNVSVHHPDVQFVRPCNLCPHMKRITLANIRTALEEMRHEVTIDPAVAVRARQAVERMLAVRVRPSHLAPRGRGRRAAPGAGAGTRHTGNGLNMSTILPSPPSWSSLRCAPRCWRISAAPAT